MIALVKIQEKAVIKVYISHNWKKRMDFFFCIRHRRVYTERYLFIKWNYIIHVASINIWLYYVALSQRRLKRWIVSQKSDVYIWLFATELACLVLKTKSLQRWKLPKIIICPRGKKAFFLPVCENSQINPIHHWQGKKIKLLSVF